VPPAQLDDGTDLDAEGRSSRKGEISSLEVSYDDGASRTQPDLTNRQRTRGTTLRAPSSAAFVSLRTTAAAHTGRSASQTVIRPSV
jgi:hypothetical protein